MLYTPPEEPVLTDIPALVLPLVDADVGVELPEVFASQPNVTVVEVHFPSPLFVLVWLIIS